MPKRKRRPTISTPRSSSPRSTSRRGRSPPRTPRRKAREEDEFAARGREAEELVDAPLEPSASDYDADEETERLATDLEALPAIPGDLMEPEPTGPRGETAFDRPLDLTTGVGSLERPKHRSASSLLWVLVVLAAIVGGVLYWRARGPAGSAEPMAAGPSPSPTFAGETAVVGFAETPVPVAALPTAPVPAAEATRSAPTLVPTRPAPTVVPTRAAATPAPTRRAPAAAPTRRPPTPAPERRAAAAAPAKPAPAPGRSRKAWLDRAARDQKSAASDRNARFAIQLELACEVPSLTEAWAHDRPAGTMWVMTTSFKGRTCFKVLWGRYASREEAARALESAPPFFSTARNHPMVVAIR